MPVRAWTEAIAFILYHFGVDAILRKPPKVAAQDAGSAANPVGTVSESQLR
jgi:hypothetical protein